MAYRVCRVCDVGFQGIPLQSLFVEGCPDSPLKGSLDNSFAGCCMGALHNSVTLRLKIAQKLYIVWSLGPKALKYECLEPKGYRTP